jgi:uncharacterized membrane protein
MSPAMMEPQAIPSSAETGRRMLKRARLMRALALIACLGMAVSSLSLYHHYQTTTTAFCHLGESFNCDLVNRSRYSIVLGVPVALIGFGGYLLVLALATVYREKAETPLILLIACCLGVGFSLYLTYVEAFVLAAWCILCLASLALVVASTALSAAVLATSAGRR